MANPGTGIWASPWAVDPLPVFQAKEKEVLTQVVGTGKTKSEAQANADRTARQVSGGSFVVLERNVNGSGTNWVPTHADSLSLWLLPSHVGDCQPQGGERHHLPEMSRAGDCPLPRRKCGSRPGKISSGSISPFTLWHPPQAKPMALGADQDKGLIMAAKRP